MSKHMPTLAELVHEHILRLNPLATPFVAVFQAVSRSVVEEDGAVIYVPWGPFGRTVFVAETPYVTDELGNRAPAGIRYFVASAAPDQETAMQYLTYVAARLHSVFQLSANAMAHPLQLRLMTIWAAGDVPFREAIFEPQVSHPVNARVLNIEATQQICSLAWLTAEERIGRAMAQYENALRNVDTAFPMAIEHLYMGVEAITKALIRHECAARSIGEERLGVSLGLDPNTDKFGATLEKEVRKQILFQGDTWTYERAKALSDGIEHGFASWEDIWKCPEAVLPKAARYLREAILKVLCPPQSVLSTLTSSPFEQYVEGGPRLAYESAAPVSSIDLRATDFQVAKVQRSMQASSYDAKRREYRYEYTLKPHTH